MLKPLIRALAVAALAVVMPASAATMNLRFGTPFVSGSNLHKGMEKFAEVVAAESKGTIKMQVYTDSQIGDIQ